MAVSEENLFLSGINRKIRFQHENVQSVGTIKPGHMQKALAFGSKYHFYEPKVAKITVWLKARDWKHKDSFIL